MEFKLEYLAVNIILKRKKDKINIRQASKISGISISTLSRIENQKVKPDIDVFAKICSWLNTEPNIYFE